MTWGNSTCFTLFFVFLFLWWRQDVEATISLNSGAFFCRKETPWVAQLWLPLQSLLILICCFFLNCVPQQSLIFSCSIQQFPAHLAWITSLALSSYLSLSGKDYEFKIVHFDIAVRIKTSIRNVLTDLK